jgi:signal transduction protein with GAF and PtsI domain
MASLEMTEIINRSASGLQASLDTLVRSAVRLCSADCALLDEKHGDELQTMASFGFSEEFAVWRKGRSITLDPGSTIGRGLIEAKPVQTLDVLAEPESHVLVTQVRAGFRTMLAVPLMRDGAAVGVLVLTRAHPQLFDETQIEIATAFADLAPSLIANAALLGDVRTQAKLLSQPCDPALPAS